MLKKIYVASSWRNAFQPEVVVALRSLGHEVYDFRHPKPGDDGFAWSQLEGKPGSRTDGRWQDWTPSQVREALKHPRAVEGFEADRVACEGADATLCVLPCGRSAHLELGVAIGRCQKTGIFVPPGVTFEPDLMYRWSEILVTDEELLGWARSL